ncbi:hypothetical protein Ddc_09141 [Ditylenchus destructor]|nr:hypothetical protein Ddc_09141 [Ditylenchus destructor]
MTDKNAPETPNIPDSKQSDAKQKKKKERDPIKDHLKSWRVTVKVGHYVRGTESVWQKCERQIIGGHFNTANQMEAFQKVAKLLPVIGEKESFDLIDGTKSQYNSIKRAKPKRVSPVQMNVPVLHATPTPTPSTEAPSQPHGLPAKKQSNTGNKPGRRHLSDGPPPSDKI